MMRRFMLGLIFLNLAMTTFVFAQQSECAKVLYYLKDEGCSLAPRQAYNLVTALTDHFCFESKNQASVDFARSCGSFNPQSADDRFKIDRICDAAARGCADVCRNCSPSCADKSYLTKITCVQTILKSLAKSKFENRLMTEQEVKDWLKGIVEAERKKVTQASTAQPERTFDLVCYQRSQVGNGEIARPVSGVRGSNIQDAVLNAMGVDIFTRCIQSTSQAGKGAGGGASGASSKGGGTQ